MDSWEISGAERMSGAGAFAVLNVAATCPATRALGPGLRSVVWVQGCMLHCPGCIAPDWIPIRPARLVRPEELVSELLADPDVTGLTFSGGEPFLQAAALAQLARLARQQRELNIICYTGYQHATLISNPPGPGVLGLLEQVDVLIDGPYIERLNDNRGLRGSSNQRVHYLSDRLRGTDLTHAARRLELHLEDGQAFVIGVPPSTFEPAFQLAVGAALAARREMVGYERS